MTSREDLQKILPDAADPEMIWMLDYWNDKRGENQIPLRSDVDPLDFYRYWPTIYFAEGGKLEELSVKVAGTAYRSLYGYEITGRKIIDLIPSGSAQKALSDYILCIDKKLPVYREGEMTWRERNAPISYNRLLLPIGKDYSAVGYILGFAIIYLSDSKEKIAFPI